MNHLRNLGLYILFTISLGPIQLYASDEKPRVKVPIFANSQNLGEVWVFPSKKPEEFLIEKDQLTTLLSILLPHHTLERLLAPNRDNPNVPLTELSRLGLKTRFDENELVLFVEIPLTMVNKGAISMRPRKGAAPNLMPMDEESGYLNMYWTDNYGEIESRQGRLELAQRFLGATLESELTFDQPKDSPWYRRDTRVIFDSTETQTRYALGDLRYRTLSFQSALPMLGLSASRLFFLDPTGPARSLNSTQVELSQPALLEVYLEESLIFRNPLPVGVFDLKEIPLYPGPNLLRLKFTDASGKVQWLEKNLIFDSQILAPGVHEFSYNLGIPLQASADQYDYKSKEQVLSLFHHYGASPRLNLGLNFQSLNSDHLAGMDVETLLPFGYIGLNLASSMLSENTGEASRISFRSYDLFKSPSLRLAIDAQRNSFLFASPGQTPSSYLGNEEIQIFLGLTPKHQWGFGTGLSRGFNEIDNITRYRINYYATLSQEWRGGMSLEQRLGRTREEFFYVNLTWSEEKKNWSGGLLYDSANGSSNWNLQRRSSGTPWDWSLSAQALARSENTNSSAQFERLTPWGRGRINASKGTSGTTNTSLSLANSFAWSKGHFALGRPVSDSFVILSGKDIPESSKIYLTTEKTSESFYLEHDQKYVLSDLSSYQHRTQRLIPASLSYSKLLLQEFVSFFPTYKQGSYFQIPFQTQLMTRGRLMRFSDVPAPNQGGEIYNIKDQLVSSDFFTSDTGDFLVLGLTPGKYVVRLFNAEFVPFELVIPDSSQDSVDIGSIELKTR